MSWASSHEESERMAASAHLAVRQGDESRSQTLFQAAAQAEIAAFDALEPSKTRTRGITAVSALSLAYKGKNFSVAESFAYKCLASGDLPDFAKQQIHSLLQSIWGEQEIESRGLTFSREEV